MIHNLNTHPIEEHLLTIKNTGLREAFVHLRQKTLALSPNIHEKIRKMYVAYEYGRNFAEVVPQTKALKVFLDIEMKHLRDPKGICCDQSRVGRPAWGKIMFKLLSAEDVPYASDLIKQSYENRAISTLMELTGNSNFIIHVMRCHQ